MRLHLSYLFALLTFPVASPLTALAQAPAGVPVIKIVHDESSIKFAVKASVPIEGLFDQWDATLTYTSAHVETGVLDVKIQAASVNTGSGMKDGKLKGKDFFNAKEDPDHLSLHQSRTDRPQHV
jgi:polyisoprenoid-binding protein YceI